MKKVPSEALIAAALLEEPAALLQRINAEEARRDALAGSKSFWTFVRQAWQYVPQVEPLVEAWHMEALCLHAEAVARADIHELCVNVPPGFSKSVLWSVLLPAWVWTWWPKCQMLFGSYSHAFVVRDARRTRDVIMSDWYQRTYCKTGGWNLRTDFGGADNLLNTAGGVRFATSVGGAGAGLRAHLIVVDDPVNINAGPAEMEAAVDWLSQVLSQRFIAGYPSRLAIVMQRLDAKDPSAWFTKQQGAEHLRLANEYNPSRPCVTRRVDGSEFWRDPRKEQGELLFPQLYPREKIEKIKLKLGPFGYAAQHQQDPAPPGGGRFKIANWRFWTTDKATMSRLGYGATARPDGCTDAEPYLVLELDNFDAAWITVDANVRETKAGSFCSIHVWMQFGARFLLVDRDKGRWEFSEAVERVKAMVEKWPQVRAKAIEAKANGDAIVSTLKNAHGISGLEPVEPGSAAKQVRAKIMEPYHSAGDMYVPEGAPWMPETIKEFGDFPKGESDDEVDCGAMAIAKFEQPRTAADQYEDEFGDSPVY